MATRLDPWRMQTPGIYTASVRTTLDGREARLTITVACVAGGKRWTAEGVVTVNGEAPVHVGSIKPAGPTLVEYRAGPGLPASGSRHAAQALAERAAATGFVTIAGRWRTLAIPADDAMRADDAT